MSNELLGGEYALDGSFRFLVSEVSHKHAIVRSLTHADDVLATEAPPTVLERQ